MSAQTKDQRGDGYGNDGGSDTGNRDREERMDTREHCQREQNISTEFDIGLLADRDEAGVARQQIPEAR